MNRRRVVAFWALIGGAVALFAISSREGQARGELAPAEASPIPFADEDAIRVKNGSGGGIEPKGAKLLAFPRLETEATWTQVGSEYVNATGSQKHAGLFWVTATFPEPPNAKCMGSAAEKEGVQIVYSDGASATFIVKDYLGKPKTHLTTMVGKATWTLVDNDRALQYGAEVAVSAVLIGKVALPCSFVQSPHISICSAKGEKECKDRDEKPPKPL